MKVECASVLINGEFRSRKMSFTHSDKILMFYDVRRKLVTAFFHVGLLVIDSNYLVIADAAAYRIDVELELFEFLFSLLYFGTKS